MGKMEAAAVRVSVLPHVCQVPARLLLFSASVHAHVGSPCLCCYTDDNEAMMSQQQQQTTTNCEKYVEKNQTK